MDRVWPPSFTPIGQSIATRQVRRVKCFSRGKKAQNLGRRGGGFSRQRDLGDAGGELVLEALEPRGSLQGPSRSSKACPVPMGLQRLGARWHNQGQP